MKRREFIAVIGAAVAAWPLTARGQSVNQVRRIGFLRAAPPPERELNAFFAALAENGYVQGRNIVMVPQLGGWRCSSPSRARCGPKERGGRYCRRRRHNCSASCGYRSAHP